MCRRTSVVPSNVTTISAFSACGGRGAPTWLKGLQRLGLPAHPHGTKSEPQPISMGLDLAGLAPRAPASASQPPSHKQPSHTHMVHRTPRSLQPHHERVVRVAAERGALVDGVLYDQRQQQLTVDVANVERLAAHCEGKACRTCLQHVAPAWRVGG